MLMDPYLSQKPVAFVVINKVPRGKDNRVGPTGIRCVDAKARENSKIGRSCWSSPKLKTFIGDLGLGP